MFAVLFDQNFKALGKKTTYYCSAWSLTRRNFEMDSLTATTEKIDNSSSALYIGMFNEKGKLSYLAYSGRPKDKSGLTKITAMDLRRIFIQNAWLTYASYQSAPTVKAWVNYLMNVPKNLCSQYGGVDYSVDVSDFDLDSKTWIDGSIPSENGIGDVWEELQAAMMRYNFTIVAEGSVTTDTTTQKTTGSITFKVKLISKTYSIKLSDFDEARVMNDSTDVNRAIAYSAGSKVGEWWIMVKKTNGSESVVDSATAAYMAANKVADPRIPARYQTFQDDDADKATSQALNQLEKNRYKGSVEISLDSPLAKELRSADPWSQALVYGYNAADDSSAKLLPFMWISENQSGQMKACFGRLDDYYYI